MYVMKNEKREKKHIKKEEVIRTKVYWYNR